MKLLQFCFLSAASVLLAAGAHAGEAVILGSTHAGGPISAGATITVLEPSANVHGATLTTTVFQTSAAEVANILTAPDGYVIYELFNPNAAAAGNLPFPVYLPPGVGFSVQANVQTSYWATYDVTQ